MNMFSHHRPEMKRLSYGSRMSHDIVYNAVYNKDRAPDSLGAGGRPAGLAGRRDRAPDSLRRHPRRDAEIALQIHCSRGSGGAHRSCSRITRADGQPAGLAGRRGRAPDSLAGGQPAGLAGHRDSLAQCWSGGTHIWTQRSPQNHCAGGSGAAGGTQKSRNLHSTPRSDV